MSTWELGLIFVCGLILRESWPPAVQLCADDAIMSTISSMYANNKKKKISIQSLANKATENCCWNELKRKSNNRTQITPKNWKRMRRVSKIGKKRHCCASHCPIRWVFVIWHDCGVNEGRTGCSYQDLGPGKTKIDPLDQQAHYWTRSPHNIYFFTGFQLAVSSRFHSCFCVIINIIYYYNYWK